MRLTDAELVSVRILIHTQSSDINPVLILVVRSLSHVRLCETPWTAACQASHPSPSPRVCPSHVHYTGDAIQPSNPLLIPFLPALDLSQHQGLF